MAKFKKIALVGCGKMGSALLRCWLVSELANEIIVIEPQPIDPALTPYPTVKLFQNPPAAQNLLPCPLIVFAVKPQILEQTLADYKEMAGQSVFLSIAAGKSIESIRRALGNPNAAVVRAMPNLPAMVGLGATGLVAGPGVADRQRAMARAAMKAAGEIAWIDSERGLDAVTAISGSGPAYVFHFCEALTAAGIKLGLSPEVADTMARQTIVGAAAMLFNDKTQTPGEMREAVTSPNGTTEAALKVLMQQDQGLTELMEKTAMAAMQRAIELN